MPGNVRHLVRMRRLAAALLVAFMVLVMAVTPLSATTERGYFEVWLPSDLMGPVPHVVLFDDTGLVRGFFPTVLATLAQGVEPTSGQSNKLTVSWLGGCSDAQIQLHFFASGDGYVLSERTNGYGCPLDIGIGRQFAVLLYSPIDASTVAFTGPDLTAGE